ncbi:MAG: PH domain-containing protein [Clostridia bacterium]|nr:PH domain-containing protein [Clostridia bacterium]
MSKIKVDKPVYLWKDRKRILGIPMTFIRYRMSEDRLFFETGFFNLRGEEIQLYRIRDIGVTISFWQRFTGVGTVTITSTDSSAPMLSMKDIKHPRQVKELLHAQVEKAKLAYRVRYTELMDGTPGGPGGNIDMDGDGIPDFLQEN